MEDDGKVYPSSSELACLPPGKFGRGSRRIQKLLELGAAREEHCAVECDENSFVKNWRKSPFSWGKELPRNGKGYRGGGGSIGMGNLSCLKGVLIGSIKRRAGWGTKESLFRRWSACPSDGEEAPNHTDAERRGHYFASKKTRYSRAWWLSFKFQIT